MKRWNELSDDEKFIAERLQPSATFSRKERETHFICPRCQNEKSDAETINC